jgi:hypothetical protein
MNADDPQGAAPGEGRAPSEEELLAAYEEEVKRLRVEDVLLQTLVSLLNLGGRKAGLAPGTEGERDLEQVRLAIEGTRALLPLVEPALGPDGAQLRQALSQLQLAYAKLSGEAPAAAPGEEAPAAPASDKPGEAPREEGTGPAQRSGRLWVPGQ